MASTSTSTSTAIATAQIEPETVDPVAMVLPVDAEVAAPDLLVDDPVVSVDLSEEHQDKPKKKNWFSRNKG